MARSLVIALTLGWAASSAFSQQDQPAEPVPAKATARAAKPAKAEPAVYDESADAKKQIAAALARAKKENRRVLIQWGANWCGWCVLLHGKFQTDQEIRKELQYEYDVVTVDVGKFDKNMDLASGYGAELKGNGIPYLTILDADGKALLNQETGSLEAKTAEGQNGHDTAKLMDLLTRHQAPYLQASEALADALARAKTEGKNVFVHFGAPWCGWCHRLEDWMARPEVTEVMGKDFVDLKIDQDRMLGAAEIYGKYHAGENGGIPWSVVLSPSGEAIVTSDGPKGNIGHPATDEEIAHFVTMMEKSAKRMTAEDVGRLRESLVKERAAFAR